MIQWAWPWAALLLPLPWLVRRWFPPAARGPALRVPLLAPFEEAAAGVRRQGRRGPGWWILLLTWLLLVAATTRPQWVGELVDIPATGRDLMLAVDLSGSMETRDFVIGGKTVNRLAATKAVARDFIERRVGDRIGLLLFGRQAYLQAPLTFDRATVQQLLDEAVIGLAGKETAIGDAIGLAVKRLRASPSAERVLVLLTDGANTAGEVPPLRAAQLAAQSGLKIYTIGIGADAVQVDTLLGRRTFNPSADLDETTLRAVAEATGGRYFRARDSDELTRIYALLDELEPVEVDTTRYRHVQALYPWPLAAALALAAALCLGIRRSIATP